MRTITSILARATVTGFTKFGVVPILLTGFGLVFPLRFSSIAGAGFGQGESFRYDSSVLVFALIFYTVDPIGGKLYCIGHEDILQALAAQKAQEQLRAKNIISRWNINTGKCEERITELGYPLLSPALSPGGRWLIVPGLDINRAFDLYQRHGEKVRLAQVQGEIWLLSANPLKKVSTWGLSVVPFPDVCRQLVFFGKEDQLGFVLMRQADGAQKTTYILSLWCLSPSITETLRMPLPSLEDYWIIDADMVAQDRLMILASDAGWGASQTPKCYLLYYAVRDKNIVARYDLGKATHEEFPSLGKRLQASVVGRDTNGNRVLLEVSGTDILWESKKPLVEIKRPRNFLGDPIPAVAFSPDGKYIVFASTRVVLYNVDEKKYRVLDTFLEDLVLTWDNAPAHSPLHKVANHPTVSQLMPVMKKLMTWQHISFLGGGNRLLGITSYGKVVVWDTETGRILNSFRIANTQFDAQTERILGLY